MINYNKVKLQFLKTGANVVKFSIRYHKKSNKSTCSYKPGHDLNEIWKKKNIIIQKYFVLLELKPVLN